MSFTNIFIEIFIWLSICTHTFLFPQWFFLMFFLCFLLKLLGWHWLVTLHRFQVTHRRYTSALCDPRVNSPSVAVYLIPSLFYQPPPYPPNWTVVYVDESLFLCLLVLFVCCFQLRILQMSEVLWVLTFSVKAHSYIMDAFFSKGLIEIRCLKSILFFPNFFLSFILGCWHYALIKHASADGRFYVHRWVFDCGIHWNYLFIGEILSYGL